jgi:hypothetical protein
MPGPEGHVAAQDGDPANGETGASAPLVIKDKVLVGTPVVN